MNYFSKTRRFSVDQLRANPDIADRRYFFFPERLEHDLQASIAVDKRFSFYAGVNNIGDKEGAVASTAYPYSFLGRFFYAGARIGLDRLF